MASEGCDYFRSASQGNDKIYSESFANRSDDSFLTQQLVKTKTLK